MTAAPAPLSGEAAWRAAVARAAGGATPEALARVTRDGIAIGPLHPMAEPASPQPWRASEVSVVQRIDHPDPAEAAAQAVAEVEGGADALCLTVRGAGAARSFGVDVAAPGVLAALLAVLSARRTGLRIEWPLQDRERLVGCVLDQLGSEGLDPADPRVDLGADPLGDAARSGTVPPPAAGWARLLARRGVVSSFFRADGRPHHEAGASEAQELGAVLSAGVAYLRALEEAGIEPRAGTLRFTLAADADQVLTAAKVRAFRRLWASVEQACGFPSAPARLHAETAWRILARRDSWTNLPRNAVACAAAILGGADSVTVLPFTGALGLPDAAARRLARNTPLILIEEAGLARVADPWAGSGTVETATEALCREGWRLFQRLEAAGGLGAALQAGTWQADVAAKAAERRAALADGRAPLVGVTAYPPPPDSLEPAVLSAMPDGEPPATGQPRAFTPLPSCRDEDLAGGDRP